MSLKVNLRHLETHEVHLKGELPIEELDLGLQDEMVLAKEPFHYNLRVEEVAQSVLVQGKLELTLHCQCVRCLKSFTQTITLQNWTLHLPLEGADAVPVDNDCVDLTPYAREDMLLNFHSIRCAERIVAGWDKAGVKAIKPVLPRGMNWIN